MHSGVEAAVVVAVAFTGAVGVFEEAWVAGSVAALPADSGVRQVAFAEASLEGRAEWHPAASWVPTPSRDDQVVVAQCPVPAYASVLKGRYGAALAT